MDQPPAYTLRAPEQAVSPSFVDNDTQAPNSLAPLAPHDLELHRVGTTSAFNIISNGKTLYYVGHYQAQNTPDIIIYAGYDANGPRLAQTQFITHSKDFKIFVGDVKNPSKDDWDIVRCANEGMFKDPSHRFECRLRSKTGQLMKSRYYWKKTSDSKLGASRSSPRDFKLVDELTEQVVAVYVEHHLGAREKRGTMSFKVAVDPKAEIVALLVLLSLLEKSRRFMRNVARAFPSTNSY